MTIDWNAPSRRLRVPFVQLGGPLSSVQKQMTGLLDEFLTSFGEPLSSLADKTGTFLPRLELTEEDNGLTVRAEVPGMKVEDVEITLTKNEVILRGERKEHSEEKKEGSIKRSEWLYGAFQRTIPLSFEVDEDKVDASVKDGILTIHVPKTTQARSETKKVSIRKA
jgi:HSP20 family protein